MVEKRSQKYYCCRKIRKTKNYPLLINAFSCVARVNEHVKLKIYGEGSLYDELSAEIKELGLSDRVFLCGRTDNILQALLTLGFICVVI